MLIYTWWITVTKQTLTFLSTKITKKLHILGNVRLFSILSIVWGTQIISKEQLFSQMVDNTGNLIKIILSTVCFENRILRNKLPWDTKNNFMYGSESRELDFRKKWNSYFRKIHISSSWNELFSKMHRDLYPII